MREQSWCDPKLSSPNSNAYVERFIQTLLQECLDYFVVLGEEHMNHLVPAFVVHYHEERPHWKSFALETSNADSGWVGC